jgi:hypothetical protein
VHACLGEIAEVEVSPARIRVVGFVETEERKSEIEGAMAILGDSALLRLEIRTAAEAAAAASAVNEAGVTVAAGSAGTPPRLEFRDTRPPAQDLLEEYFRRQPSSPRQVRAGDIAALTREIVRRMEETHTEAWALRRLAVRFGGDNLRDWDPGSLWLLQSMIEDHVRILGEKSDLAWNILEPVLGSPVASPGPEKEQLTGENWAQTVLTLFGRTNALHRSILHLFAGSGFTIGASAGEAIRDLPAEFASLRHFVNIATRLDWTARASRGEKAATTRKQEVQ